MASSFLDDLLKREIDEKAISDMVGSLESQLASPTNPGISVSIKSEAPKAAANHVSISGTVQSKSSLSMAGNVTTAAVTSSPIPIAPAPTPGANSNPTTVVNIAPKPLSSTPVQLAAPRNVAMAVLSPASGVLTSSPQYVTTTMIPVELLNRLTSGVALSRTTPTQSMAHRLLPAHIQNLQQSGTSPQPIMIKQEGGSPKLLQQVQQTISRSGTPPQVIIKQEPGTTINQGMNRTIAPIPATLANIRPATSISQASNIQKISIPSNTTNSTAGLPSGPYIYQTVVPRTQGTVSSVVTTTTVPSTLSTSVTNSIEQVSKAQVQQTTPMQVVQGQHTVKISNTQPNSKPIQPAPQIQILPGHPVNSTNTAQHNSKTPIQHVPRFQLVPGQHTVNAAPSQQRIVSTTPQINITSSQVTAGQSTQINSVKEQVQKLKSFFQNLIRLASQQSEETGKAVGNLIQSLMDGKISEDDFTIQLQRAINSSSPPQLSNFIKATLPLLKAQHQATQLQQRQQQPQVITTTQQPQVTQLQPSQQAQPTPPQPGIVPKFIQAQPRPNSTPQKIQIPQHSSPKSRVQQQQQQMMLQKHIASLSPAQQAIILGTRRNLLPNTRTVSGTLPAAQVHSISPGMIVVPATAIAMKTATVTTMSQSSAQAAAANQDKHKHRTHHYGISSAGDDDINDVTTMAGVNLVEESARILAVNSDLLSTQTRSCKDENFLYSDPLRKKIDVIAKKYGLTDIHMDVIGLISHAAQERLRTVLEKVSTISLHRVEILRDNSMYQNTSDVKSQLRVFEEIDEVERKRREAREREVLMRAAKSRSRQEDPEQAKLKEKAKQLQLEEEEILRKRAANSTALMAIGPRKKRKLDEIITGSTGQSFHSESMGTKSDSSLHNVQITRQRTRRIILKDIIFVLEQEKETSKSTLLYKVLLK